jgi:hypothetical protein
MATRCRRALPVLALIAAGCGAAARPTVTAGHTQPGVRPFAVGKPLAPRAAEVGGIPGTVELRVEDPGRPSSPSVFVTLGRTVPREPNDVCFGTYVANENPEEDDVSCQVRGRDPLILTLGHGYLPNSPPVSRFTTIWGQVNGNVDRVRLIGPGATDTSLPLSAHRMFLVAFSPTARGTLRLLARLADGTSFTHAFTLPLTDREAGAWPRVRRRGAVFNYGIGENIVTRSYRQILKQFGPPLKTFIEPAGVRCIYYDLVGYNSGWRFCFKGQAMFGATGNQAPPAGIR